LFLLFHQFLSQLVVTGRLKTSVFCVGQRDSPLNRHADVRMASIPWISPELELKELYEEASWNESGECGARRSVGRNALWRRSRQHNAISVGIGDAIGKKLRCKQIWRGAVPGIDPQPWVTLSATVDIYTATDISVIHQVHRAESFRSRWSLSWPRKYLPFMEPKVSALWSQEPAIGPYPDPDESNPRAHTVFP